MEDPTDAASAAPTPTRAPASPLDLLPYAPYALLVACLVALRLGVDPQTVGNVVTVALVLIDPRQVMGRRS
jgi:hypothetical protein